MPAKPSDPRKWLLDIRDNIRLARAFTEGADFDAFRDNQLLFYAVTRALEIISEAIRPRWSARRCRTQPRLRRC